MSPIVLFLIGLGIAALIWIIIKLGAIGEVIFAILECIGEILGAIFEGL